MKPFGTFFSFVVAALLLTGCGSGDELSVKAVVSGTSDSGAVSQGQALPGWHPPLPEGHPPIMQGPMRVPPGHPPLSEGLATCPGGGAARGQDVERYRDFSADPQAVIRI